MSDNTIAAFCPDDETRSTFLHSMIGSSKEIIAHYDFVLNDIQSEISNPKLESTKQPAIDFLKAMRAEWQKTVDQVQKLIDNK